MTAQLYTALLNRANTGNQILQILDVIVEEITQENIASCAEVFAQGNTNG
jgi:hypothetical protein